MSRLSPSTAVASPYSLRTSSYVTSPISGFSVSFFESAGGQAADNLLLGDDDEDGDGDDPQQARRGHEVVRGLEPALVAQQPPDDGRPVLHATVGHQEREEVLVVD